MIRHLLFALAAASFPAAAQQRPPLLSAPVIDALTKELSGERALETIKAISANHRVRGSKPFRAAADFIVSRAREGGLEDAKVEEFPADGKIFYGTQRSRPPWDAEFAELREITSRGSRLVTSWAREPMSVAEDSESGDVTTDLVDVGAGSAEKDYAGRNVKGKLILVSSQPDAAVQLGVAKYGAAGIVSYAQNQRTGWWGENTDLVRWGHLDSFSPTKTFAFMISPRVAQQFRNRLARGERVKLHAKVKAGQHPGAYSVATAMIRGADPLLSEQEIVFSCHLDHPNPGANDNASGCATILEVGVTLSKLIKAKKLARPARTIRFVWPPEIEGTMAILNAKPEWAKRIKAVVHMDMVGAGLESKSVFHVSSGPGSLPSFVYDIAQTLGGWVNDQTYKYAATGESMYPLVSPRGGKEPLLAALDEFDMGSDHQVYAEGSWRIPAIYLHDWPDRYIHTTWDTPGRIDPTKLQRSAFIGAATGYFLAIMSQRDFPQVKQAIETGSLRRLGRLQERLQPLDSVESANLRRFNADYETKVDASVASFGEAPGAMPELPVRGPMSGFGYNYLTDKLGAQRVAKLRLPQFQGLRGGGGDYAYEVLNLARRNMSASDIRDAVSAIYGPVPKDVVLEYLLALQEIGVVKVRQ